MNAGAGVRQQDRRWTESGDEGRSWAPRPAAAFAVRALALLLPLAASVAATAALSRIVPRPDGLGPVVGWWVGITVVATLVLVVVDRLTRRLLPLAALLTLSLAFPDQTPSRLSVALRAGSTSRLERRLEAFADGRLDGEPAKAATTILSLAASLSAHDRRTRGHSERVRALAEVLAAELGITGRDLEQLRWAALLHDIGKLQVAHRVLNKPGAPNDSEWRQLRRHPVEGERLVEPLRHWLGPWADAVRDHHERWDGMGYPAGRAGEEISYAGRVVAVVDAFETITATRPYKRPLDPRAAKAELARSAGTHFDPAVVRAFLGISVRRLRLIMGPLAWLGALPFVGAVPEASVRASLAGGQLAAGGLSAGAAATGVVALSVTGGLQPTSASTSGGAPPAAAVADADEAARRPPPERSTSTTAASGATPGQVAPVEAEGDSSQRRSSDGRAGTVDAAPDAPRPVGAGGAPVPAAPSAPAGTPSNVELPSGPIAVTPPATVPTPPPPAPAPPGGWDDDDDDEDDDGDDADGDDDD